MSGRLEGKKILVTAAGQGIGKATAIAFHLEGAQVTATDLNDKTLADLNKEYSEIKVQKLDSTDNSAILEFTKTLEKVDVLFNACLLYTSPSPRDFQVSRMPSSA